MATPAAPLTRMSFYTAPTTAPGHSNIRGWPLSMSEMFSSLTCQLLESLAVR